MFVVGMGSDFRMVGGIIVPEDHFPPFVHVLKSVLVHPQSAGSNEGKNRNIQTG
jgi:hypothetical protein